MSCHQHTYHEIHPFLIWVRFFMEFDFMLILDFSFVASAEAAIACEAFENLFERLVVPILNHSHPCSILEEIYQFDFMLHHASSIHCCLAWFPYFGHSMAGKASSFSYSNNLSLNSSMLTVVCYYESSFD